jgi:hypothetical protein
LNQSTFTAISDALGYKKKNERISHLETPKVPPENFTVISDPPCAYDFEVSDSRKVENGSWQR